MKINNSIFASNIKYMKPRIFIGSSSEALNIAYAIQSNLEYDATVTVWTQNIFQLSSNSLDDLLNALENFDFGLFIFKPDDITLMRSNNYNVVRDNVIFELGLFFGKLGKGRVFFCYAKCYTRFSFAHRFIRDNSWKV